MLRFASKPDDIFTKIVTDFLQEAIENLNDDIELKDVNYADGYFEDGIINAFGGGLDGVKMIRAELEKLLKAHQDQFNVYMPTDRHFQLMDRLLTHFCDIYNDRTSQILSDPKELKKYKSLVLYYKRKPITKLEADTMLGVFFWDNDYDMPTETAQAMTLPQNKPLVAMGDFSREAIASSLGLPVDCSNLKLEKQEPSETWKDPDKFQGESSSLWFPEEDEDQND